MKSYFLFFFIYLVSHRSNNWLKIFLANITNGSKADFAFEGKVKLDFGSSHDFLSVHFLWKPLGRYLTGIVLGTLVSLFRIVWLLFDVEPYYLSPFWGKGGDFLEERVSL